MKKTLEFIISLTFNIHKLTLIYVSVFKQWFEQEMSTAR